MPVTTRIRVNCISLGFGDLFFELPNNHLLSSAKIGFLENRMYARTNLVHSKATVALDGVQLKSMKPVCVQLTIISKHSTFFNDVNETDLKVSNT